MKIIYYTIRFGEQIIYYIFGEQIIYYTLIKI